MIYFVFVVGLLVICFPFLVRYLPRVFGYDPSGPDFETVIHFLFFCCTIIGVLIWGIGLAVVTCLSSLFSIFS